MLGGVKDIADVLSRGRFSLSSESSLQLEVDPYLREAFPGVEISREHRLDRANRPDWLIDGRFVVEAKISRSSRRDTVRQVQRYAEFPQVEAIVLITGRSMPPIRAAKPVLIVHLGRAWL
ncbi:hypothetical protein [Caulobacter sp. RL271]|uniref:DUF4143 domain-containing protein n=1 Tax=Caulobacter segnis TaxID=88688 RepID=A0ABY4ZWZ8_9CAUL|nr:hypothetical protein [Caulobacter segnis]USQ97260.1 hypothetical protein MZV50_06875 [Caulobacter segnis]